MQRRSRRWFLGTSAGAMLGACASANNRSSRPAGARAATLVLTNGVVWTGDAKQPRAQAIAIAGDTIVALGDDRDVRALAAADTPVLDLAGGMAVPGLVDAHAHLVGLGRSLEVVDLRGARSIDEVVARLLAGAPKTGWVLGRGWDQNLWPGAAMPTHAPLTAAFPDRPVWLRRVDGHAGWANRTVLELAKIDRATTAPAGGEILRDGGEPTGVLVDAAMGLVSPPPATKADVRRWILAGAAHALARGLTGMHEMGIDADEDAIYRELASAGELPLRVVAYASEGWLDAGFGERVRDEVRPDAHYLLRGVKLYADGALGSRGAALLADYADRAGHRGLMQQTPAELLARCEACVRGGWQIATHAIGDAANRAVLDAYASALQRVPVADARLRIEHCQILDLADIPRFAELGVVASMQPTHATSDMPWVPDRVGTTRLAGAYAWRRILAAGVPLAFGSDFPVEDVEPTHGLYSAITRRDPQGQPAGGWLPDQTLTLVEALAAFTRGAAFASHREDHLGMVRVGMKADLTCFATPLDEREPLAIRDAEIRATIVAGAPVFTR
ncbi:MAG TPA: amidohydrolase [Nannocystaceae bacterium]|nr:amidohydrolase [Nannocystaceae bacterium]